MICVISNKKFGKRRENVGKGVREGDEKTETNLSISALTSDPVAEKKF